MLDHSLVSKITKSFFSSDINLMASQQKFSVRKIRFLASRPTRSGLRCLRYILRETLIIYCRSFSFFQPYSKSTEQVRIGSHVGMCFNQTTTSNTTMISKKQVKLLVQYPVMLPNKKLTQNTRTQPNSFNLFAKT